MSVYYIVRFEAKRPKILPDGREVSFTERTYYTGKGKKEVVGPHQAAYLDKPIAEAVVSFYPEKKPQIIEENNYLTESEADSVHTTLATLGESVSAEELESTVRAALRSMTKTEAKDIFERATA